MQEFERFIVENAHACICAFKSLLRQRVRFVFPFCVIALRLLLRLQLGSLSRGVPSSHLEKDERLILGHVYIYS